MTIHHCDCSRVADRKDATGWSCAPCRKAVSELTAWLDAYIRKKRAAMAANPNAREERAEYMRRYQCRNRKKLQAYWRDYDRRRRAELSHLKSEVDFNPSF